MIEIRAKKLITLGNKLFVQQINPKVTKTGRGYAESLKWTELWKKTLHLPFTKKIKNLKANFLTVSHEIGNAKNMLLRIFS